MENNNKAAELNRKNPEGSEVSPSSVCEAEAFAEQNIKVSVVMPVYNACKYLRPAMDSLMDQTLREIEIICVDDGSTDTSLDMIKIYQKQDNRIRIITETNAGPGLARNNGLKRARGQYVAFLDADDFYELDMLEKLYVFASSNDLDIAISKYDIFENKKAKFRENIANEYSKIYQNGAITSKNEYPDYILESTTGSAWNKLFKKSFLLEKGITFLPEAMMFEDVYFTVCALALAERVAKLDEVLVHHRIYNQQSRVRTFGKYYPHAPAAFEKTKEFLMKSGMYQPLKRAFLNLSCSRCYHIYNLLKSDAKEVFWNMLHDYYAEALGWHEAETEDFDKKEICEFCANIERYTFEQYSHRKERGLHLNTEKLDQTLKQNKRRRRVREFFAKLFVKHKKKDD